MEKFRSEIRDIPYIRILNTALTGTVLRVACPYLYIHFSSTSIQIVFEIVYPNVNSLKKCCFHVEKIGKSLQEFFNYVFVFSIFSEKNFIVQC
jgi:hypothetical protein